MAYQNRQSPGDEELDGPRAPELDVLGARAPAARAALIDAWDAAHREVDPALLAVARRRVEDQLGCAPDERPEPDDQLQQAIAALTDQFVFYVPHVTEELLAPVRVGLGEERLQTFMDALYVLDQTTRLRISHGRLFDGMPSQEPASRDAGPTSSLADANSALHASAMQLDWLDPITTEIVRLRAANYHDCKT